MGHLIGFGDFERRASVAAPSSTHVGAAKAAAPPPTGLTKNLPTSKPKPYGAVKQTKIVKQHAQVLNKAKETLLKAARGVGRAQLILAQKPASASAVQKAAATAAAHTAAVKTAAARQAATTSAAMQAHPGASIAQKAAAAHTSSIARSSAAQAILGAVATAVQNQHAVAPAVTAKLTPKAKAAVEKHNKALAAAKQAAQKLAQQTLKTRASVKELAKAAVNQKKVSMNLRAKGAKAHVGELLDHPAIGAEVAEALLGYYESVGAGPDPTNPGYLTDGSPDPAFATTGAPTTTTPDASAAPSLIDPSDITSLSSDQQDQLDSLLASQGQPAPDITQPPEDDYKLVGGIPYNESKGRPNGFVGSEGLFTRRTTYDAPGGAVSGSDPGTNYYGFVYGSFDQDSVPNGIPWGGRLSEGTFNKVWGRYVRGMAGQFNWPVSDGDAFASYTTNDSAGQTFGPLVGNPGMPDFKGMRVDKNGVMFWYPQEAPDWLTFPLKQAPAITAAKQAKAAADEQAQFAAEQAKQQRDAQAQQAAQDAANALAESQAQSASNVAQSQAAADQAAQETAAQQQLVEAAQQQTQQDAAEAQQEQQAQQLLIEQATRQQQLLAQHPDIELALMAQDQGLAADDGSGDDGGDDASAADDTGDADSGDAGDFGGGDLFSEGGDEYSEG